MAEIDELTERLGSHVQALAGEIGERNVWRGDSLARAATWIEEVWEGQGFDVARQSFEARGVECSNLEVTVRGAERPDEIVLLGAHYDTVRGCPGANDDASGVSWSDHRSFWRQGFRNALMVTDTAPYRYSHYHLPTDTPDRIDASSLAEVTRGLAGMARSLAG